MFYLLALAFLLPARPALAATYQQCPTSATCTIGEFLYDDEYALDTDASCDLTASYPNGSSFLDIDGITAPIDAWYHYDATIDTTEGLYPTTLCCSSGADYLCIDKTFEVTASAASPSPGLTAAEVWSYSSRSLTDFGDLIADIWDHSTRSLTTFGDLIANIWTSAVTTSTSGPAQQITAITQEQQQQRVLLEKLVNAPVVSLSLEEGQTIPDLNVKLEQSRKHAQALYDWVQSGSAILFTNPSALTALVNDWDAPVIKAINLAVQNQNLDQLKSFVGHPGDTSAQATLFGFLAYVAARDAALENQNQKLALLLENWQGQGETLLTTSVTAMEKQVLALNQYPGGGSLIQPTKTNKDKKLNLKNLLFNLKALLGLNRQLLAVRPGDPIRSLWLEEGSIIFRAVITNPSSVISQTVPLKFFLPRELKTENIIGLDPSLETHYDTTEEALFVSGSYTLKPQETKLVAVEVEDIWQLTASELDALKNQAAELLRPLEKTSYFAQGTVLKSEIDVTVNKILLAQSKAIAPENRIRTYREAQLELSGVNTNMARLQDLVAQASGTGSIFGFIGGVQAVAVWGIIIIVIAGFVFLAIYMRQIRFKSTKATKPKSLTAAATPGDWRRLISNPALIPLVILATTIVTVIITQALLRPKSAPEPTILEVAPASPSPSASPSPLPQEVNVKQEKQVLGEATPKRLTVPEGSSVNVRFKPDPAAAVVMAVKTSLDVYVFETSDDWSRIDFSRQDSGQSWWVSSQFLD